MPEAYEVGEKWYIFDPERGRGSFREIDPMNFGKSPGHILLSCEVYLKRGKKRAYLELLSPSGEEIETHDKSLTGKKSVQKFNTELQKIVNLAHKLST